MPLPVYIVLVVHVDYLRIMQNNSLSQSRISGNCLLVQQSEHFKAHECKSFLEGGKVEGKGAMMFSPL